MQAIERRVGSVTSPYWASGAANQLVRQARGARGGWVPPEDPNLAVRLWEMSSPSTALYRHMATRANGQIDRRAIDGLGQTGAGGLAAGLGAGMIAAVLLVAVAVNYQLGKAMAPNEASEPKWAWGNAIAGTVFPPFTVGMAVYKNYFRG